VRYRNRDAALALFRRVVNRIKRAERHLRVVLRKHLGDRRGQCRFAVVNVTNRPYIHVRLTALEFLFRHPLCSSNQSLGEPGAAEITYFETALPLAFAITSSETEEGASA
jgi:hypothetical protein